MSIGSILEVLLLVAWFAVSAAFTAWVVTEWHHSRRPQRAPGRSPGSDRAI
jgi:hypothetical protein